MISSYNLCPSQDNTYSLGVSGSDGTQMLRWKNIYVNNIYATGTVSALSFNATSDYRIKENIKQLDNEFKVDYLNPVSYVNKRTNKQDIGLIAHELQEHYPQLVNGEKDGRELQSINYIGLIPVLINEMKNMKKEIENLKATLYKLTVNSIN